MGPPPDREDRSRWSLDSVLAATNPAAVAKILS